MALALDWGAGPIVGFPTAGHAEFDSGAARLNQLAPEMHLDAPRDGDLFMTDAFAFTLAGVPDIAPDVRDPGYSERAHSAEDTLDKVKATDLRQSATVLAVTGFFLADTPELLSIRFSADQVAASLLAGKQRPMLEALGLWPF